MLGSGGGAPIAQEDLALVRRCAAAAPPRPPSLEEVMALPSITALAAAAGSGAAEARARWESAELGVCLGWLVAFAQPLMVYNAAGKVRGCG